MKVLPGGKKSVASSVYPNTSGLGSGDGGLGEVGLAISSFCSAVVFAFATDAANSSLCRSRVP
jgi:hypothetical protein